MSSYQAMRDWAARNVHGISHMQEGLSDGRAMPVPLSMACSMPQSALPAQAVPIMAEAEGTDVAEKGGMILRRPPVANVGDRLNIISGKKDAAL